MQLKQAEIAEWADEATTRVNRLRKLLQQLREHNADLEDGKERLTPAEFLVDTQLAESLRTEGMARVQTLRTSLQHQLSVQSPCTSCKIAASI